MIIHNLEIIFYLQGFSSIQTKAIFYFFIFLIKDIINLASFSNLEETNIHAKYIFFSLKLTKKHYFVILIR